MGDHGRQHLANEGRGDDRSAAREARRAPSGPARAGAPAVQRVLSLQRTAGNAAVARLLSRASPAGPRLARSESGIGDLLTLTAQAGYAVVFGGPSAAIHAWNATDQAIAWANQYFSRNMPPGWQGHIDTDGGPRNALRHCLWSALTMTRALRQLVIPPPSDGEPIRRQADPREDPEATRAAVREALLGHEFLGSGGLDSDVDRRNNEVGMDIGQRLDDPAATDEEAYAAVRDACYAALEEGRLKMLDENGRVRTTAGWRDVLDPHIWDRWAN